MVKMNNQLKVLKGLEPVKTIYLTWRNGVYYSDGVEVSSGEVERLKSDKSVRVVVLDVKYDAKLE